MGQNITRKIQLVPIGDKKEISRVYNYLSKHIEAQNKAMNQYISSLYAAHLLDISEEDRKELRNLYSRIPTSKKGSGYDTSIEFQKGIPLSNITRSIESDFKKSLKDGLMYGKVSLPTYKKNNPMLVHVNYCDLRDKVKERTGKNTGIFHNYKNHEEFLSHLYKTDLEVFLQFTNNILFKFHFGDSVKKSSEIRSVMRKIFEREYTIHGSQIQLKERKTGDGDDIFLLLCIEVPEVTHELSEDTVVGVDLGVANPAVCALNTKRYPYKYIGDGSIFIHHKQKYKNERTRLQRNLKYTSGGHGRKKKLRALNRLRDSESNFATTFSHKISKDIVDFAISNNAKYINIEDLKGIDTKNTKLLECWKYFELQQFITYKAARHGITVRKINPEYTSQTCSICGNREDGQRDGRNFHCKACGAELDADYNAARVIAMSTNFVEDKKKKKKKKEESE